MSVYKADLKESFEQEFRRLAFQHEFWTCLSHGDVLSWAPFVHLMRCKAFWCSQIPMTVVTKTTHLLISSHKNSFFLCIPKRLDLKMNTPAPSIVCV